MSSWALLGVFLALPLCLLWGLGELVHARDRIRAALAGRRGGGGGARGGA
jgi:hypothetical protein